MKPANIDIQGPEKKLGWLARFVGLALFALYSFPFFFQFLNYGNNQASFGQHQMANTQVAIVAETSTSRQSRRRSSRITFASQGVSHSPLASLTHVALQNAKATGVVETTIPVVQEGTRTTTKTDLISQAKKNYTKNFFFALGPTLTLDVYDRLKFQQLLSEYGEAERYLKVNRIRARLQQIEPNLIQEMPDLSARLSSRRRVVQKKALDLCNAVVRMLSKNLAPSLKNQRYTSLRFCTPEQPTTTPPTGFVGLQVKSGNEFIDLSTTKFTNLFVNNLEHLRAMGYDGSAYELADSMRQLVRICYQNLQHSSMENPPHSLLEEFADCQDSLEQLGYFNSNLNFFRTCPRFIPTVSVSHFKMYSPVIPGLNFRFAGSYDFQSEGLTVGIGKAFFSPLPQQETFGVIAGMDVGVQVAGLTPINSPSYFSRFHAKVFLGFGLNI